MIERDIQTGMRQIDTEDIYRERERARARQRERQRRKWVGGARDRERKDNL